MYQLDFVKTVNNISKLDRELRENNPDKYNSLCIRGDQLKIYYSTSLTQMEVDAVSSIVNNFVEVSVQDQIADYLTADVGKFIDRFMDEFAAENMLMGITQMGKTAGVVGVMAEKIILPGETRGVSILDTMESKSLTVTIQILDHMIANMTDYEIAPFITTERLTNTKAKILEFLS